MEALALRVQAWEVHASAEVASAGSWEVVDPDSYSVEVASADSLEGVGLGGLDLVEVVDHDCLDPSVEAYLEEAFLGPSVEAYLEEAFLGPSVEAYLEEAFLGPFVEAYLGEASLDPSVEAYLEEAFLGPFAEEAYLGEASLGPSVVACSAHLEDPSLVHPGDRPAHQS